MAVNLERQLLCTFVIISGLEKIVGYTVGADKFAPSCPLGLLRTHPLPCPLPRSGGRRLAWSTCIRLHIASTIKSRFQESCNKLAQIEKKCSDLKVLRFLIEASTVSATATTSKARHMRSNLWSMREKTSAMALDPTQTKYCNTNIEIC